MLISFGREVCGDLAAGMRREWWITNGLGGYAAGTVAGPNARCYHGLLVAARQPPTGRYVLLAKVNEILNYAGQRWELGADEYTGGVVNPQGYLYLQSFHLEGLTPVWTYAVADALLEKRVTMVHGSNTTYIVYSLLRASRPVLLTLIPFCTDRDHHAVTQGGPPVQVTPVPSGVTLQASWPGTQPYYLRCQPGEFDWMDAGWWWRFHLQRETDRGLPDSEDYYMPGRFSARLNPSESLTLVASTEPNASLDGPAALAAEQERQTGLLSKPALRTVPRWIQQLTLAADTFVVQRTTKSAPAAPDEPEQEGTSVIAGYPWFTDWGRDTMISLAGLTLMTGRAAQAAGILRTFARFVDQGMIPNRFPDQGEQPEYNTADATLWFFEAIRAYVTATGDTRLLQDLYPVLQDIVAWHERGTRYKIKADPDDGLLCAGEPGVQLTWMDAKVDNWVVTPRIGKPIEINALWYNALNCMSEFATRLGAPDNPYPAKANRLATNFNRFWNTELGYCYDVLDGPQGNDPALRPNQIFAVSLPYSALKREHARQVVDVVGRTLVTSYGLRSLAADDPAYHGTFGGKQAVRDAAYHQGTVWGWLLGPFALAHYRVYQDRVAARRWLEPLEQHLHDAGLGTISEIFEGNPPFTPKGCPAQAWSVAETLRAWFQLSNE